MYVPWDGTGLQKEYIEKQLSPNTVLNIIGHSFGGNAAIQFAGELKRKVNLLITVDPVKPPEMLTSPEIPKSTQGVIGQSQTDRDIWQATATANMAKARKNVKTWVNIMADPPKEFRDESDFVADRGQKYDYLPIRPKKFVDAFVQTPENHANFARMIACYTAKSGRTPEELVLGKDISRCR